jgi:hypothetical protein
MGSRDGTKRTNGPILVCWGWLVPHDAPRIYVVNIADDKNHSGMLHFLVVQTISFPPNTSSFHESRGFTWVRSVAVEEKKRNRSTPENAPRCPFVFKRVVGSIM